MYIKRKHEYEEILIKGKRIEGKIIKQTTSLLNRFRYEPFYNPLPYKRRISTWLAYGKYEILYHVMVEYDDPDTNKRKTYITPALNFIPKEELSSLSCSVYIYNSKVYITDFEEKKDGQECVFLEEEINNLEK